MKKLLKSVVGLASVAAVAAGAYYVTKKWMDERDEDFEDEFEDMDFDEEDSREYVTLDLEEEEAAENDENSEEEELSEEDSEEEFSEKD